MRQINVMIADDDELFCELFGNVVTSAGYQIYMAYNPEQCIAMLQSTKIDILFLDLCYPAIKDGYEVLDYTHENYPEIEIIMISGVGNIQDAVRTLKCGAIDFIEKPIPSEQLLAKIKHFQKQLSLQDRNKDLAIKAIRMVGSSKVMQTVFENIILAAQFDSPVLITGETGVGKELVAKAIHKLSCYSGKNMITVNCGAIPSELVESELFGFEQGSFTGALKARKGYFEYADGSTILLDEISELPFQVQAKLLRILSEGEMQKLGGRIQNVNCRIICSTNRDLPELIKTGGFREDLYYRINTIHIDVPPLRFRKEDIPELAIYFLNQMSAKNHAIPKTISAHVMNWLVEHEWKGNVRELRNIVERGVIFAKNDHLTVSDLQPSDRNHKVEDTADASSLRNVVHAFERSYIYSTLHEHNWNITHSAKALELDKSNLLKKMKYHNIVKPT